MRIIAGTAKGRRLFTPAASAGKSPIRPTSDRAREAVFNILGEQVLGARVLDLFAGTGAMGLEALSRGAAFTLFVDHARQALDLIARNIQHCGFSSNSAVIRHDLSKSLFFSGSPRQSEPFALVFMDAPWDKGLTEKVLVLLPDSGLLAHDCLVVAEERADTPLAEQYGSLCRRDFRRYGDTGFWFFTLMHPGSSSSWNKG